MTHSKKETFKYILTKVDDHPTYVILTKCNYCPFLINDSTKYAARCSKYINKKADVNENLISKVNSFYAVGIGNVSKLIPFQGINIPTWCNLKNRFSDLNDSIIHTIKNGMIFNESIDKDRHIIHLVSDEEIKFDSDGETLISRNIKRSKSDISFNKKSDIRNNFTNYNIICSSCGKEKNEVNRDKNNGLCNGCLEKSKNDKVLIYNSIINNFRLKRKINWKKNNFKRIKNINV